MAPLPPFPVALAAELLSMYHAPRIKRDDAGTMVGYSKSETMAVMAVSFSFATISVAAAIFAFFWFVKMKRGFRQDLVMLLIQSDMMKAFWLIASPIFYFITQQPFSSNHAFCQVSGFFLTAAIEASDIAVLLIAIHTALFILKGQHAGVAVGLQPYRRVAYTFWVVVPIILAAIVPLSGANFVDDGAHCYLPTEPSWYRSGLSWVPRYVIFGFIIVTYSCLYLYVYIRLWRFGEHQRRTSSLGSSLPRSTPSRRRKWSDRSIPPTPALDDHGLLSSRRPSAARDYRQDSVVSTVSTLRLGEPACNPTQVAAVGPVHRRHTVSWNLVDFGEDAAKLPKSFDQQNPHSLPMSPTTQPSSFSSTSMDAAEASAGVSPATINVAAIRQPEPIYTPNVDRSSAPTPPDSWGRRGYRRPDKSRSGSRFSIANLIAALRSGPDSPSAEALAANVQNQVLDTLGRENLFEDINSPLSNELSNATEGAMRRAREKTQRQMRLLFVYPAIYLLTWVAPFAAHISRYDTSSNARDAEPLVLHLFSIGSLCAAAAVNCCFFSAWERPWNHTRKSAGFWACLFYRLTPSYLRRCGWGGEPSRVHGRGRTKDERVRDARVAIVRREREKVIALRARMDNLMTAVPPSGQATDISAETALGTIAGQNDMHGTSLNTGNVGRKEWWDMVDEEGRATGGSQARERATGSCFHLESGLVLG
ncbi:G protein-coupled glucose receptor regulating Gpa2-domain-containing protein [Xylariaceae sp. FL0255]|nr:G protein-coupled glucose receptor regulating Gpa2-domain-containing protein [Xylariaceae sp. FL0255]